MRTRRASFRKAGPLVAVGAVAVGLAAAPTSQAATFEVGSGQSVVKINRPGAYVDEWASSQASGTPSVPHRVVIAWTEVKRAKARRHRWTWRTYTAWCGGGTCTRPVKALESVRSQSKTPGSSVTPWRLWVSSDMNRSRAVVKAGIRWGERWAIVDQHRLVGSGPTDNVWNAGYPWLTHTTDGQDWITWNNDHAKIRISQARNGKRLSGPIVATGDTAVAATVQGRWVLLSFGRAHDDDTRFPVNLKTAPTVSELSSAPTTQLAPVGFFGGNPVVLGADSGPLLVAWQADNPPVTRATWVDGAGALTPTQTLPDVGSASGNVYSIPTAGGGLAICPWNLATAPPLGAAIQAQAGVCNDNRDTNPVRLRQR